MVQPFTFRNNYQLGHRFFKCFFFIKDLKNTEVSNWCIDQVRVDLQQNEIQVKFFLLLFFSANKCFNLFGRKVIAVNNKLD
jgi:hypothetical protein